MLYYLAGVRFQSDLVHFNFQFIDVELMKHRLLESLFYYHMQPPLHNLIVGLVVKTFPQNYGAALHGLFLLVGAVSSVLLYRVMRCLDVPVWLAALLTILFITSPGCVLFENFPMYEYLIMLLLLAQCVALYHLLERPGFWPALLFFSLLAALALLRALFHLYYVVAAAVALAFYLRANAKAILAAAVLPVLSVLGLYSKNLAVFGIFASSSWLGNNLCTITTHQLTESECSSLVAEGKLSAIGCVNAMEPVSAFRAYVPPRRSAGIPVLDQETKSTGDTNYNHVTYLETSPLYAHAAGQVLRYYPVAYLRSVLIAWFSYFRSPTDFFQFQDNLAAIRPLERFSNVVFFGQLREAPGKELRALRSQGNTLSLALYTGVALIIVVPTILLGTIWFWIRGYRERSESPSRLALLAFIVLQVVMVTLIVNFLSSFENNRYRFPLDPLYLTLLGVVLARTAPGMLRSRLQIRLVTGSYSLVKLSRLLSSRWGRRFFIGSYFLYKRHLEDPFYNLIRRHPMLFRGGHVIDVGANIGYTATLFAGAIDPGNRVYAFEPEDINFALMEETLGSFQLRDRVVPVQAAVGATDGTVELARSESHPGDHHIATSAFRRSGAVKDSLLVPLRSLDSFVDRENLGATVRFIKIDVQGYEPAVCWGMERTLTANPECTVVLEYAPEAISALGFEPAELLRWFSNRDYHVYTLHRDGRLSAGVPENLDFENYADLLFSRSIFL